MSEGSTTGWRQGGKPRVSTLLRAYRPPLKIWVAPDAHERLDVSQGDTLPSHAELRRVPISEDRSQPEGPAVMLLTEEDLRGPHRNELLQLAQVALPGRPIIYGSSHNRNLLLDAINTWQAFRLMPVELPLDLLADAIRKAYDALSTATALELGVQELRDECRHLESAVHELEATQERLLHGQRLATIGKMTGMLSSKTRAHLEAMDHFASTLEPFRCDPEIAHIFDHTIEGSRSVNALLSDLLALAENRDHELTLRREALDPLVERVVALFKLDPMAQKRTIETECSSNTEAQADRYRLYHVLLNLLRNAAQATEKNGVIRVITKREGSAVHIEVHDNGRGIPDELMKQLFTPFFTTKGKGGVGLGLRMSRSAIERMGGTLECTSVVDQGSCFSIKLQSN